MAPNNALGNPTAAKMRAAAEGRPSKSPARRRSTDVRKASADGFGAGEKTGVLDRSEVTSRGTGTATRTPLAKAGDAIVFDYRTWHRGTPNCSEADRPVLYLVVGRKWWVDSRNYNQDESLSSIFAAAAAEGSTAAAAAAASEIIKSSPSSSSNSSSSKWSSASSIGSGSFR